jgi:hypothetical protein
MPVCHCSRFGADLQGAARNSVAYVASLSLRALVSGHWSAWQAARVEVAQKKEEERRVAEDMAGEIVERVVQETEVDRQR